MSFELSKLPSTECTTVDFCTDLPIFMKLNEGNSKSAVWFNVTNTFYAYTLILRLSSSIRIGLWLLRAGRIKALGLAHPRNRNETSSSL